MSHSVFRASSPIPPEIALGYAERVVMDGSRVWFTAEDGSPWCAHEVFVADLPGAQAPTCLFFESSASFRRVWRYPSDWTGRSRDELLALSRGK
jgi:hypothetical protein